MCAVEGLSPTNLIQRLHLDSPKLIKVKVIAHLVATEQVKEHCHG